MSLFIEIHLIQNFAPSNLNRDDTGAPKDAIFGGHRRARVSSQCFKRAIREAARTHQLIRPEHQGVRTKKLLDLIVSKLEHPGTPEELAVKTTLALEAAGLKLKDGKTEYLLFLGDAEVVKFAALVDRHWDALVVDAKAGEKKSKKESKASSSIEIGSKEIKTLLDGGKAVDVALFGRMLADMPEVNQDAACQVAHAISTHRVEREFDYFTAVDDESRADETGAGMIGQVEFNSATFYRYLVLNASQLLGNLQGDRDLTLASVDALVQAAVRAIPTGKQNSFAAQNLPTFVGISVRSGSPLSLANAFEKPIVARHDRSLTDASVAAMADYETRLAAQYGQAGDEWAYLDLTGAWPADKGAKQADLTALATWARAQADKGLGA